MFSNHSLSHELVRHQCSERGGGHVYRVCRMLALRKIELFLGTLAQEEWGLAEPLEHRQHLS